MLSVEKLIKRFGSPMTLLRSDGQTPIRAFFHETYSKSQMNALREFSYLGEIPKGSFTYIGPADAPVSNGDGVFWYGRTFEFRRAEPVMLGDTVMYYWGVCLEIGKGLLW